MEISNFVNSSGCKAIILCSIFLAAENSYSQTCTDNIDADTPYNRFKVYSNGTVWDLKTNLVWKRCSEGQAFDDDTWECTGTPLRYNWQAALRLVSSDNNEFAGSKNWRLPNIKELSSIIERKCFSPAINLDVFPNTPPESWLSSTPEYFIGSGGMGAPGGEAYRETSGNGLCVHFNKGETGYFCRRRATFPQMGGSSSGLPVEGFVRLVRYAQ